MPRPVLTSGGAPARALQRLELSDPTREAQRRWALGLPPAARLELGAAVASAQEIIDDPCCSTWLRQALVTAIGRDPVDAANDAEVLAEVLGARAVRSC